MKTMVLDRIGAPLRLEERRVPGPGRNEVLLRVSACAVCRTDLHIVDGELPLLREGLVPGHEIVARVERVGAGVDSLEPGQRVGVPWLGRACGECRYCRAGNENLCDRAQFTGYHVDGGFAEYTLADARFCLPMADQPDDSHAAPLLCAGLIGYRCLRMAGDARRLGLYGFGAAAHILTQVAVWESREVFAFTRPGDAAGQRFARDLGATWAGDSTTAPPELLDAAILFAPVGALVPVALRAVRKGGTVVCGGIHMSDIPSFPYALLWGERVLRSVTNLTRRDGIDFLAVAPRVPVRTTVRTFRLEQANDALDALRAGALKGAAVLVMDGADTPAAG
ncbi:MAG: zinc-dependent alcohol dehydrogenase family protein [Gemmatimonadetes bacterium]|nr:zinc-dependent alcohol dehydrogenase family protein [Gemmatimonadota bacterium]